MKKVYVLFVVMTITLSACKSSQRADLGDGLFASIKTNMGDIIVRLEHEKAPVTVANFVSLAEGTSPFVSEEFKGKKYYDGVVFHRIMKGFLIQGGDPTGTGTGGPGYKFKDELNDSLRHSKAGILSMGNTGFAATNGSQFFITHGAAPWLDGFDENGFLKPCENPQVGCHSVFGEVVEGLAVVDSIASVEVGDKNKPIVPVTMETVAIIRNGKEAKKFNAVQVMTDYFAEEQTKLEAEEKIKTEFAAELDAHNKEAKELPSGLKIFKIKEGSGEKPKIGQKVKVFYAGYLPDGTLFDSNYEEVAKKFGQFNEQRKQQGGYEATPMDYSPDSNLVAGFKEAMLTMKVGDKFRLFLPPHLGWGPQGSGPIPPNSDTIFDLEIIGVAE